MNDMWATPVNDARAAVGCVQERSESKAIDLEWRTASLECEAMGLRSLVYSTAMAATYVARCSSAMLTRSLTCLLACGLEIASV